MKKRFLATLVAVLTVNLLVGCGDSHGSANPSSYSSSPAAVEASSEASVPESSAAEVPESSETEASRPAGVRPTEDEAGTEAPSSTPVSEETESTEIVANTEAKELHGIIIIYHTVSSNYRKSMHVGCIDPETGGYEEVAVFPYDVTSNNPLTCLSTYYSHPLTDNYQESFSSDYTKLVETKAFTDSGEIRVGWMNADGTYFDLTEALGEQSQSDFNSKKYLPCGFTPDDRFVYHDKDNPGKFFYVYVDNPTVKYETDVNPLYEYYYDRDKYTVLSLTGIIDETHYIAANSNETDLEIMTLATNEEYKYGGHGEHFIQSNERRFNYTGVVSPDGTEVAFLSKLSALPYYKLYVMPLDGSSDPREIKIDSAIPEKSRDKGLMIVRWQ